MQSHTQSIQNLMNELARLPGIGTRSAERIAFHLLKQKPADAMKLAEAIRDVMKRIASGQVREIIMGTNPNMEGDGTALHIQQMIVQYPNVSVTRLARGLP